MGSFYAIQKMHAWAPYVESPKGREGEEEIERGVNFSD